MSKRLPQLIPFKKHAAAAVAPDGNVVEYGTVGIDPHALDWEIHSVGTIHILNGKGQQFKKDCDKFEEELDKVPLDLLPGNKHVIRGSGDNDDLVIENVDGDYRLSLTRRGIAVVEKLKELVGKARKLKKGK